MVISQQTSCWISWTCWQSSKTFDNSHSLSSDWQTRESSSTKCMICLCRSTGVNRKDKTLCVLLHRECSLFAGAHDLRGHCQQQARTLNPVFKQGEQTHLHCRFWSRRRQSYDDGLLCQLKRWWHWKTQHADRSCGESHWRLGESQEDNLFNQTKSYSATDAKLTTTCFGGPWVGCRWQQRCLVSCTSVPATQRWHR
jgi:hypothetical protein